MKLSFIIPMYNVENYIERCLNSLLLQDISSFEYEIIVVDDGSTDNSSFEVKKLQQIHSNIQLITKNNGGASSARNLGLSIAKGDYIWMVDSDDTIKENCLKNLLDFAFKYELDFVSFPIYDVYETKTVLSNYKSKPVNIVVNNLEYLDKYFVEFSPCCFLVKRNVINDFNVRFIEGITQEDLVYVIMLLEHCSRISSYQDQLGLYNYYLGRPGSVTSTKSQSRYMKTLESFYVLVDSLNKKYNSQHTDQYGYYAKNYINNFKCYALAFLLYFPLDRSEKFKYYKKFKSAGFFKNKETRLYSRKMKLLSPILKNKMLYQYVLGISIVFRR